MQTTWIVVARESGTTLFEYGDGARRLAEIPTRGESVDVFVRRVVGRLEWEATIRPPSQLILLALRQYLGALRLALPPALASRVRVASNAVPTAAERAYLRALLRPLLEGGRTGRVEVEDEELGDETEVPRATPIRVLAAPRSDSTPDFEAAPRWEGMRDLPPFPALRGLSNYDSPPEEAPQRSATDWNTSRIFGEV